MKKHLYATEKSTINVFKTKVKRFIAGARISFVRQFRQITQDELADKLKLKGERKRMTITIYEKFYSSLNLINSISVDNNFLEKYFIFSFIF